MAVLGVFFVAYYFVPHPYIQKPGGIMLQWKLSLGAAILFFAASSLIVMHIKRVKRRERRWGYSAVTLVSMALMLFFGMVFGVEDGGVFANWFQYLITPIESTMFSLLAFFVASAAFRAFRARTWSASVLLLSAFVVMIGLVPVIENHFSFFSDAATFILEYPNSAAKRAILIGTALGAISVAVKTIVGMDKTILRKRR
jgi:hypothetical protein